jgi:hypothetical protein
MKTGSRFLCSIGILTTVAERILLVIGIILLVGGLGVWGIVADRHHPTLARSQRVAPPPNTEDLVGTHDGVAPEVQALLERTMLSSARIVRLFDRASTPIYGIVVPGRDAIEVSDRLRRVENASHSPLLLGDGWDLRAHDDATRATTDPPHAIIERARDFDLDAWIVGRLAGVARELRTEPTETWTPHGDDRERFRLVRDSALDLPRPSLTIALVPTRSSVETPAWLAFGNWRGCPEPTVHVAMLTRWQERYGAEVIGIGSDTIELRVQRPPTERDSAIALAREHVAYAPSLLAGGTRSIDDIAESIAGARVWSFRFRRSATIQ